GFSSASRQIRTFSTSSTRHSARSSDQLGRSQADPPSRSLQPEPTSRGGSPLRQGTRVDRLSSGPGADGRPPAVPSANRDAAGSGVASAGIISTVGRNAVLYFVCEKVPSWPEPRLEFLVSDRAPQFCAD